MSKLGTITRPPKDRANEQKDRAKTSTDSFGGDAFGRFHEAAQSFWQSAVDRAACRTATDLRDHQRQTRDFAGDGAALGTLLQD